MKDQEANIKCTQCDGTGMVTNDGVLSVSRPCRSCSAYVINQYKERYPSLYGDPRLDPLRAHLMNNIADAQALQEAFKLLDQAVARG